jgi:hypothetical protein
LSISCEQLLSLIQKKGEKLQSLQSRLEEPGLTSAIKLALEIQIKNLSKELNDLNFDYRERCVAQGGGQPGP